VRRAGPSQRPTLIRSSAVAPASELAADRARALALTDVSRETTARLDRFVELLLTWQRTTNLIAPSTVPRLWTRHIADSLQLLDLAPDARVWVDLGGGACAPDRKFRGQLSRARRRGDGSGTDIVKKALRSKRSVAGAGNARAVPQGTRC
jgi:rRNA small subunit methyltransferase G